MKHYCGYIFLCWGQFNRVLIGMAFFKEEKCYDIVWSDSLIKKTLKAYSFPKAIELSTIKIKPNDHITRKYWDGHMVTHSHGLIQYRASAIFSWTEEFDHKKFAKKIIER